MNQEDANRVGTMMHDLVGGLVTALYIPGVHGQQTTQVVVDRVHHQIDFNVLMLTDS